MTVDENQTLTKIRILVLETDILPESSDTDSSKSGNGTGSVASGFQSLLSQIGQQQDPKLSVHVSSMYVVGNEDDPSHRRQGRLPQLEDLQRFDGVLITGSKHDAHGDSPWIMGLLEFLKEAWQKYPHIRFTGVCFGHQILSRLLGGKVSVHPTTWELSHTPITLTSVGQKLFAADSDTIHLQEFHQDFVEEAPTHDSADGLLKPTDKIDVWGKSDDCPIQGLYIRKRLFTTQGHLGYDEAMIRENIELAEEHGSLEKGHEEVEEAKEKAELDHDGDLVGGAILRFLAGMDDSFE